MLFLGESFPEIFFIFFVFVLPFMRFSRLGLLLFLGDAL